MRGARFLLVALTLSVVRSVLASDAATPQLQPERPYCVGEYADDFAALSRSARETEGRTAPYTYCVRTSAVYECPSYVADGSLRTTRMRAVAHGTAFAFRREGRDTLLLTNEHVASWPAATDAEHVVENVPAGCRRISEDLRIVDDEADAFDPDDIPLSSVVSDPALDVSVLRAPGSLPVLPWQIGHSAGLRERNVVDVRGFPLGALRANNVGKVVSAHDHDEQRGWNHDDFVVDALLSRGNSGSPVLAISCRTGELELVGVYHAGYEGGSAPNDVVGIDQVRDLMDTLQRRSPRPTVTLAARDRHGLQDFVAARTGASFPFPVGPVVAIAHARSDGALVYEVQGQDFPVDAAPRLVIEDLPARAPASFGETGRIWAGNRQGLRLVDRAAVEPEILALLGRTVDALRRDAVEAMTYAEASRVGPSSREQAKEVARLERNLRKSVGAQSDLVEASLDTADQLCPPSAEASDSLLAALWVPPGPALVKQAGARSRASSGAAPGRRRASSSRGVSGR